MVQHEKFGMGRIARFNVEGKKLIAEIIFIIAGKKTLDLNIARIKKV